MAARLSAKELPRYSVEFKRQAVKLTRIGEGARPAPGDAVAVAAGGAGRAAAGGVWANAAGREGAGEGAEAAAGARARARAASGGARAPKKSHPVLFRTKADMFAFVDGQRGSFKLGRLCALLGVSRAGYYPWCTRGESARRQQDRKLLVRVRKEFCDSGGTYGSPRVQRALRAQGTAISRRRVERLMREAELRGRVARVYRSKPGRRRLFEQHPNLLWREMAQAPGQIWVSDVTYVRVAGCWRFLATVMDQYSRRLLAWRVGRVRNGELTRAALDQALRRAERRPRLIFHSDRGSEYAGATLSDRLRRLQVRQSMTRGGAPGDNAHAESLFHTLKAELVHGKAFTHDDHLRRDLRRYVRFYNLKRLHSSLGYRSPIQVERDTGRLASRSSRAA